MNRITIFYLSALSCLSFASAQEEETKEYCKLSGARVDGDSEEGSQTFNQEDLFLYETVYKKSDPTYSIRDGSGIKLCKHEFSIRETSTIVTEGEIIIRWLSRKITLTLDGNTFEFHQHMFPRLSYQSVFTAPITEVIQGDNQLQNIDGFRTKKAGKYWVCTLVEGSKPRLIFPTTAVVLEPTEGFHPCVSLTIKASEDIPMTIRFTCRPSAEDFRKIVQHGPKVFG